MVSAWIDPARAWSWSGVRRRHGVVGDRSALRNVNPVTQVFREHMVLEGVENGRRRVYPHSHLAPRLLPQELKALVALAGGLEFVQWFFALQPHPAASTSRSRPPGIVVLRRT